MIGLLKRSRGFTLVELVATLIVVGILAVVAIPRFFDRQTFDLHGFHSHALAMMRHAQKLAVAQNRDVHVRLDGGSFAFCFSTFGADGTCTNPVPAPSGRNSGSPATLAACGNNGNWFCEAIPKGIVYAAAPATTRFYFNALGKPFLAADVQPNSSFARLAVSLTAGGIARNIIVEAETGYVHP